MDSKQQIHTNLKYIDKNPISRFLINNFQKKIKKIIRSIDFESLLDIGCGEGIIIDNLRQELKEKKCLGIDLDPLHIEKARTNAEFCNFKVGDIYDLTRLKKEFDFVISLEVLEHLTFPEKAVQEIKKVSKKYLLFSVPREPVWKILNMARGKYLKDFGNTPGHINHWSSKSFICFLSNHFIIEKVFKPLPWTIVLVRIKQE